MVGDHALQRLDLAAGQSAAGLGRTHRPRCCPRPAAEAPSPCPDSLLPPRPSHRRGESRARLLARRRACPRAPRGGGAASGSCDRGGPLNGEEPELRRALDARSGRASPEFRAHLMSALSVGRPVASSTPRLALAVAMILAVTVVGVLVMARQGGRIAPLPGAASGPRILATPAPSGCAFCPIQMPTYAQVSAPSDNVVWVLVQDEYLARSTDRGGHGVRPPLPAWSGQALPLVSAFM